ncbi:hypothetical protein BC628DRAFT_417519 [Trametes gibbosa]|nr:hypothetical protein BC628DRAFT_417519 [Trametes gibbosa]
MHCFALCIIMAMIRLDCVIPAAPQWELMLNGLALYESMHTIRSTDGSCALLSPITTFKCRHEVHGILGHLPPILWPSPLMCVQRSKVLLAQADPREWLLHLRGYVLHCVLSSRRETRSQDGGIQRCVAPHSSVLLPAAGRTSPPDPANWKATCRSSEIRHA